MQNLQAKKKKYAELIIQFWLHLQQGQNLLIKAPIDAFDFVKLVAEEAYNAGVDQIFINGGVMNSIFWNIKRLQSQALENRFSD